MDYNYLVVLDYFNYGRVIVIDITASDGPKWGETDEFVRKMAPKYNFKFEECNYMFTDSWKPELQTDDGSPGELTEDQLNDWWYELDFKTVGDISNYKRENYDSSTFSDITNEWWENLSLAEKRTIYDENE